MRNLFTQTLIKNCQATLSKLVKLTFSSANSLQRVYFRENQEPGKFMGFLANFHYLPRHESRKFWLPSFKQ